MLASQFAVYYLALNDPDANLMVEFGDQDVPSVVGSQHPVILVDPLNDLAVIQQTVEDVVVALDNFCDNGVCVLCQLYFNSLYFTTEHISSREFLCS